MSLNESTGIITIRDFNHIFANQLESRYKLYAQKFRIINQSEILGER